MLIMNYSGYSVWTSSPPLSLSLSEARAFFARRSNYVPSEVPCEDSAIESYCPGHPNRPSTVVQENSSAVRKRLVQLPKAIGVSSLFIGMILASQRVANGINQIQYEARERKFLSYRYEARFQYRYWMIMNRALSIRYTRITLYDCRLMQRSVSRWSVFWFFYIKVKEREKLCLQLGRNELSRHVYFIRAPYTRKMRLRITKITFDLRSSAVYNSHRDKLPPTRCIFVAAR